MWEPTLRNLRGEGVVDKKVDEGTRGENVDGQDVEGPKKGEDTTP